MTLVLVLMISWIGPQFLYQIRPYTFYISGYAFGCILMMGISGMVQSVFTPIKFPWNYLIFLTGYIIGYQILPDILHYIILGVSIILIIFYMLMKKVNSWFKVSLIGSLFLCLMVYWQISSPIVYHEEQAQYEDKILYAGETQYHKLVVTQWQKDYWYFIDQLKYISSIDEFLYYEPMVHSVFKIATDLDQVLVIGGENGCLVREILKYKHVSRIDVMSYDTLLRNLGMRHDLFILMNKNAFSNDKVHLLSGHLLDNISTVRKKYHAVFMDLPDPRSIETNQFYTVEFYRRIRDLLMDDGIMITQAGSPYFATQAFYTIGKTIGVTGFNILPIHNQILTLGEWGWFLCSLDLDKDKMKKKLVAPNALDISTEWFNAEAAQLISSFGKTYVDTLNLGINTLDKPIVYQYYLKGNWNLN